MFLLPFNIKLTPGENNVIAIKNVLPKEEKLQLHRIQISAETPVQVDILVTREIKGKDISGLIANSSVDTPMPALVTKGFFMPEIGEVFTIKTMMVAGTQVIADEKDAVTFNVGTAIVIKITNSIPVNIAGNILWKQPERIIA